MKPTYYLYVFEDGSVGQRTRPPDLDDIKAVADGLVSIYRSSIDGPFEEMDDNGDWLVVTQLEPEN